MRAPVATRHQAVSPPAATASDRLGSNAKATQAEVAADAMRATITTIVRALNRSSAARASAAAASKIPHRERQLERSFDGHCPDRSAAASR